MAQNALPPSPPAKPLLGHTIAFTSDPFGFVRRSVESTGDMFHMQLLGRDACVFANPGYIETVLSDRDTFAKLDDFEVAFGQALLSAEGEQWHRQRRVMDGFFSPDRIGGYTDTMLEVAQNRVETWSPGQPVRLDDEMPAIALHNLFEVILGQSPARDEVDELAEAAHALNLWFKPTSWILPEWVPTPARYRFQRASAELRDRARTLLADTGDDPDSESLLATLAALSDNPETDFDRPEVLDQVVGMLFAGHETTALALTYALHQIGSCPTVAERFYAEIDAVLGHRPTLSDLRDLDYLERLVSETLRLYPPVHTIPRVTTDSVEMNGHTIPADMQVLLSVWSLHRDSRFYDNPLEFDPDRWIDTSPREQGYAFVPFGAGPRICIGRHLARLELKTVLATIGQRYRVVTDEDIAVAPQMTTQPAHPVPVRIEERGDHP